MGTRINFAVVFTGNLKLLAIFICASPITPRGVYFRIDARIPTSSGFITAYIIWLPKHVEELGFTKWATPSKYLLIKFRLNLPPSLMAPIEWTQHISDLQDMKRLFTLCQSRKIFLQVSYSARDLERVNWIIHGVQSQRLGSHDICHSFLGDSGKIFVVADDFPCSRSPSPDSSELSLSDLSSDTSSRTYYPTGEATGRVLTIY